MNGKIADDYLVVSMKALKMTKKMLMANPNDTLHFFGWTWTVVVCEYWGQGDEMMKSMTLHRTETPINFIESGHTNCFPVIFGLKDEPKAQPD